MALDIRDALKLRALQQVRPVLYMGCDVYADDRGSDQIGSVVIEKFKVCSCKRIVIANAAGW